jgi:hypothetical protein
MPQPDAVAHARLPAAVAAVLAAPAGEDVLPELAPITVPSHDEVADVAEALSTVQSAALVLAAEQAVLRRHSTDALVSLGRRNQNMLDRQLEFITLRGGQALGVRRRLEEVQRVAEAWASAPGMAWA